MKLSEFELEVMQFFWQHQRLSAPEAHQLVEPHKDVSYSTVKTIIDRLEKKGALQRDSQQGRTIFYKPAIESHAIHQPLLKSLVKKVFGGKTRSLFAHLITEEKLSKDDIEYLEQLIAEKKKSLEKK